MATQTKANYYLLLSLLGALVVAVGVLAPPTTPAQAQVQSPSIDKECTPNPVQVGQQLTCTIEVEAAPDTVGEVSVTDTFPAGVTVTEAFSELVFAGIQIPGPCTVVGNTVRCPPAGAGLSTIRNVPASNLDVRFRVTVKATAEQCGTFANTATATGLVGEVGGGDTDFFTVEDIEQITVEGCGGQPPGEQPPGGQPPGGQPPGAAGGGDGGTGGGSVDHATPISQESEQDSEAGEIDQSFEVS